MSKIELYHDVKAIKPYIAVIPAKGKRKAQIIYAYTDEGRKKKLREYFHKTLDK